MRTNQKLARYAAGNPGRKNYVRKISCLFLILFGSTACSASLPDFSTSNITMLGGFNKSEKKEVNAGYEVVLAKQAAALNPRSPVEATIRDVL